MNNSDEDYWTETPDAARQPALPDLISTTIVPLTPLDTQFGIHPIAFFPTEIADTLQFAAPKLFAILDGASIEGLPEYLEGSDVAHQCLYQGQAASELRDVAPYLVALDADTAILRQLFTRADGKQNWWDTGAFILVQSDATIDALNTHLRRFIYITDKKGVGRYLRFWDPQILGALISATTKDFLDPLLFFGHKDDAYIEAFILPDPIADMVTHVVAHAESPSGSLKCSPTLMNVLRRYARESFASALITHCEPRFPETFSRLESVQQKEMMLAGIETAQQFNLTQRGPVTSFMEMQLVLGVGVSDDPMYPWVQDALGRVTQQNQMAETEALINQFSNYINKVYGAQNVSFFAALERAQMELNAPAEYSYPNMLARVFPEKFEFIGPHAAQMFLKTIRGYLSQYPRIDAPSTRAYVLLCFFMGHRCAQDPQYAWIGSTLKRSTRGPLAHDEGPLVRKSRIWINAIFESEAA